MSDKIKSLVTEDGEWLPVGKRTAAVIGVDWGSYVAGVDLRLEAPVAEENSSPTTRESGDASARSRVARSRSDAMSGETLPLRTYSPEELRLLAAEGRLKGRNIDSVINLRPDLSGRDRVIDLEAFEALVSRLPCWTDPLHVLGAFLDLVQIPSPSGNEVGVSDYLTERLRALGIEDLKRDFDTAIVYITHDLGVVARVCNYLGVMYAGEMVETGSIEVVYDDPKHPYTQGLMRCVPKLGTTKESSRLYPIRGRVPAPKDRPKGACIFAPRCDYATDRCHNERPQLREIRPGHSARCFYSEEIEAKVDAGVLHGEWKSRKTGLDRASARCRRPRPGERLRDTV